MTKMQKMVLLMTFWFSPPNEKRVSEWQELTGDRPFSEDELFHIISCVINGIDEKWIKWQALEEFKESQMESMGLEKR